MGINDISRTLIIFGEFCNPIFHSDVPITHWRLKQLLLLSC